MIFQSLAPQFNFKSALRHLTIKGRPQDSDNLKEYLLEKYQGTNIELYHKGRTALAEAVRIATGGKGRVLVTGLTCYSVEQAVLAAGCRPIFVDITYKDLQFSKSSLEKAFEDYDDIKAIIIQNTLGVPASISTITQLAKEKEIAIIEDLAHSVGSRYLDGTEVGMIGDVVMLSFGRDKAVDVTNGGAVITRADFNRRLRKPQKSMPLKSYVRDRIYPIFAKTSRFFYPIGIGRAMIMWFYKMKWAVKSSEGEVDYELKMSNWQARLALEKLKDMPATIKHRQEMASKIIKEIYLTPITNASYEAASLIRVPFVVENRHEILQELKSVGIYLEDVWYDAPVSPRRHLKDSLFIRSEAPKAVKISNEIINIPTYTNLTKHDLDAIILIVNRVAKDAKR